MSLFQKLLLGILISSLVENPLEASEAPDNRVAELVQRMTLAEKIGQMSQKNASDGYAPDYLGDSLRAGRVGSVLNIVDLATVNELQRISVEESRLARKRHTKRHS